MKSVLQDIVFESHYLISEFTLGALVLFLVLMSIMMDTDRFKTVLLCFTSFVMLSSLLMLVDQSAAIEKGIFMHMITIHSYTIYFKAIIIVSGILAVLMYFNVKKKFELEPIMFIVTIVLGLNFLISSSHFLMTYVSLELVSLTSYALVYRATAKSSEASLKYLLYGAVASAILLYGVSLVYGITGTLDYGDLSAIARDGVPSQSVTMFTVAMFMVAFGLFFKIGFVPMHLWIPDVYEAAETPVTAFFSIAPKVGGIVALMIMYAYMWGFLTFETIAALAVATILAGNLPALWQNNLKRLLAYSSIAHSGFLMLAFVALGTTSLEAMNVYLLIYMIMNFAAFYMVQLVESKGEEATLNSIAGLGKSQVILGVFSVVLALSLTGLPPTGGFMAKLFVLTSFWDLSSVMNSNVFWIVFLLAIINTAIALFYYIKIPYYFFFKNVGDKTEIYVSRGKKILLALIMILLLVSFIKINWLIDLIGIFNY